MKDKRGVELRLGDVVRLEHDPLGCREGEVSRLQPFLRVRAANGFDHPAGPDQVEKMDAHSPEWWYARERALSSRIGFLRDQQRTLKASENELMAEWVEVAREIANLGMPSIDREETG